ncbi:MAG: hypothetical protein J1F12_09265, partial [Muribaculaceae bacterium]|nr:hypothetical protein [Muribaculaceae bacterium]
MPNIGTFVSRGCLHDKKTYLCTMIRFLITIMLAMGLFSGAGGNRTISSVETNGSWVYMYDARGTKYKTLSAGSVGTVMGYSSTFFVS